MNSDRLTVVVAAHDEAAALPLVHPRIRQALDAIPGLEGHVLYVDDGSSDATWEVMQRLAQEDPRVAALRLSRNFGKEAALTAGLDFVEEGAALILDADGQDPPELIPQFVALWREGYDDVFGTRLAREGEGWIKRATASAFYRVIGRLSKTPIPADTGDFRLLSPRALAALKQLRERHRFMKGLFGWVGFRRVALPYRRGPRLAGNSKFGWWRLWNFALEGITSFSTAPLRVATYLGLFTAASAFGFALWVVGKAALYGDRVAGWPTMMAVILFLGGVQLIALGLIGEYLGRLYEEAKRRPLYLVDTWQAPGVAVSVVEPLVGGERDANRSAVARREGP
ncbi:glycosyltransferase family 2 protein [Flavobacterium sp. MXW15]|uniref:Glycosyltransferase family 2 protein n=1 Tax=Xanthomonas chitinilytica TaxID=2989819 RepID=A0ABT3JV66_9XANT|nr:glycosyltransferase family 2 protein [Xanthomonas sp. H13-6]MCW4455007.1 glycosyltransferase family 2 protein [Flavobacterium sp. MXW15]MCW4472366.1 glycosyltransferase family 2 protein [Xanthomonas sp. H13-6]